MTCSFVAVDRNSLVSLCGVHFVTLTLFSCYEILFFANSAFKAAGGECNAPVVASYQSFHLFANKTIKAFVSALGGDKVIVTFKKMIFPLGRAREV